jgi:hypothetical protein
LVAAAQKEKVIRKADADLLDTALAGGEHSGHQSQKARGFGIFSTQNFIFRATTLVATGLVLGASQQIGKEAAKDLVLAKKAVRMIVSAEEPLLRFLSGLPADIRAAVRDLIDKLKAERENPDFPLPQPPKPEPPRERRREKEKH